VIWGNVTFVYSDAKPKLGVESKMRKKLLLPCWVGIFALLVIPDVSAQPRGGFAQVGDDEQGTDSEIARAKKLFLKGRKLFAQKEYKQAIESFKAAYFFWKRKEIQFNIALAYFNLGDEINAVTHLRMYLAQCSAEERKTVPKPLMKLQQKVGVLIVQMPRQEAEIWVNNRLEGQGRVEKVVRPGEMKVEIKIDNEVVATKSIPVDEGTQKVWELTTIPSGKDADDKGQDQRGGGQREIVKVKEGLGKLHWAYFTIAAGLTVVAGGVVAGVGVKTMQIKDEYEENQTDELEKKGERYKLGTNIMIGVTAAAGVSAAVLAVFTKWSGDKKKDDNKEPSVTGRVTPFVGPGSVGFSVTW